MKKPLTALLAAGALGLLVASLLRPAERGGTPRPVAERAGAEALSPAGAAPVASSREDSQRSPAAREAALEPAAAPVRIDGRIVVLDERDAEHAAEDGALALIFWDGAKPFHRRVPVERGRFAAELSEREAGFGFTIGGIELRGRKARRLLADGETPRFEPLADAHCDLRARWEPELVLHVVDARDGTPLAPVWIAEGSDPFGEHPGSAADAARELGRSPVRMPLGEGDVMGRWALFARSPGFAWERVELFAGHGGERVVSLEPGGELEVYVVGELSGKRARLHLYDAYEGIVASFAVPRGAPLAIEGLAPGAYSLRVELGAWHADAPVLAEARAAVAAGERARVELRLAPPPPLERVLFAGALELPEEWALADFALVFVREQLDLEGKRIRFRVRRGEMQARGDVLLWTAPDSPPGRYEVELAALAFAAVLELPEGGTSSARIRVPPPCDVAVRCVDAETGAAVERVTLDWSVETPGALGRSREAGWDAEAGRWRFRAPLGRVLLSAYSDAYEVAPSVHELHPGHNELELRLARPCGLEPALACDGMPIPWADDHRPSLEPLEGQRAPELSTYVGEDGMGLCFYRCEPGLYRLVVPPLDGYEPVAAGLVRLERGEIAWHVVELRRSPR